MKYHSQVKNNIVSVYESGVSASSMPVFQIQYNAFNQYGRDIVILARQGLPDDPVQTLLYITAVGEAITYAMGQQTVLSLQIV